MQEIFLYNSGFNFRCCFRKYPLLKALSSDLVRSERKIEAGKVMMKQC